MNHQRWGCQAVMPRVAVVLQPTRVPLRWRLVAFIEEAAGEILIPAAAVAMIALGGWLLLLGS
jgi:hypothetical protein